MSSLLLYAAAKYDAASASPAAAGATAMICSARRCARRARAFPRQSASAELVGARGSGGGGFGADYDLRYALGTKDGFLERRCLAPALATRLVAAGTDYGAAARALSDLAGSAALFAGTALRAKLLHRAARVAAAIAAPGADVVAWLWRARAPFA